MIKVNTIIIRFKSIICNNSSVVDFIKIDELFIKNIALNKKSFIITKAIVDMAKEFNIETIAEYVHNRETFEVVRDLGVDYSQGYYFSEPKPNI